MASIRLTEAAKIIPRAFDGRGLASGLRLKVLPDDVEFRERFIQPNEGHPID